MAQPGKLRDAAFALGRQLEIIERRADSRVDVRLDRHKLVPYFPSRTVKQLAGAEIVDCRLDCLGENAFKFRMPCDFLNRIAALEVARHCEMEAKQL